MNDKKSYKDLGGMFAWHVKNTKPMTGSEMPTHFTDIAQLSGSPPEWAKNYQVIRTKNLIYHASLLGRVRDWFKKFKI